jgi:N-acetylneuraminic acid mutarotase
MRWFLLALVNLLVLVFSLGPVVGGQWKLLTTNGDRPTNRSAHVSVLANDELYIYGGDSGAFQFNLLQDFYKFNFETLTWTTITPPSPQLLNHNDDEEGAGKMAATWPGPLFRSAGVFDVKANSIYIFGGAKQPDISQPLVFLNDLYRFDIAKQEWELVTPRGTPPEVRSQHNAVIHDRHVYIFGGINSRQRFNDLHKYNIDSNEWINLSPSGPLPTARSIASAVVVEDSPSFASGLGGAEIIVFGGNVRVGAEPYVNDIFRYNIAANAWRGPVQTKGRLPMPRVGHTAVVTGHRMIVFGGYDWEGQYMDDLHYFNTETNAWEAELMAGVEGEVWPSPRYMHRAAIRTVDGASAMYIYGGYQHLISRSPNPVVLSELWKYQF